MGKNADYWDVLCADGKVRQSFAKNGVEMTYQHLNVHLIGEEKGGENPDALTDKKEEAVLKYSELETPASGFARMAGVRSGGTSPIAANPR